MVRQEKKMTKVEKLVLLACGFVFLMFSVKFFLFSNLNFGFLTGAFGLVCVVAFIIVRNDKEGKND